VFLHSVSAGFSYSYLWYKVRCAYVHVCDIATGSTLDADPLYTSKPELPRVVNTPSNYDVDDSAAVGQQTSLDALGFPSTNPSLLTGDL